jgi:hypothetical protein
MDSGRNQFTGPPELRDVLDIVPPCGLAFAKIRPPLPRIDFAGENPVVALQVPRHLALVEQALDRNVPVPVEFRSFFGEVHAEFLWRSDQDAGRPLFNTIMLMPILGRVGPPVHAPAGRFQRISRRHRLRVPGQTQ